MNKTYKSLELPLVKKIISDDASFSMAKEFILNEEVSFNPLVIKHNLRLTKEALNLIKNKGRYRFDEIKDISNILKNVMKSYTLTANELVSVLLHNTEIKRSKRYFKEADIDELLDYIESLYYSDYLINEIGRCINLNGDIKDDASVKLKNLKEELINIDDMLNERAKEFIRNNSSSLMEDVIYTRNDRICFLVINSNKNKFDGFNYGDSASGQASYVEPRSFIELNNKKSDILNSINEEIKRILKDLSIEVAKDAKHFIDNLESLMILDAIFAKANYAFMNDAIIAEVGSNDLYLKDVGHPLIDKKKLVYNTYEIAKPTKAIVISGSNTGGKTVSLKVIGLSVLMTYLGIPLIASEAHIPFYDAIYDDIDDSQSLVDSLSTFSSRLVSLDRILKNVSAKSLVLIDEIASGTDPKEGEALALAIIKYLDNVDANFVITTHFNNVKKYALATDTIMLSAQSFDTKKMCPTYKYIENSLGQSNALEIASRYLDQKELIDDAKAILKENETKEESLIRELEKAKNEALMLKQELALSLENQKNKEKELEDKIKKFKEEEALMFEKANIKVNNYIEKQKAKARKALNQINKENLKVHEVNKVMKDLEDMNIEEDLPMSSDDIKLNDIVKVISTNQVGKVVELKKDKVTVIVNGISLKTKVSNLTYLKDEDKKVKVKKHVNKEFKARPSKELLLVGYRVSEALEVLAKYLDEAYGADLTSVKIIHGFGTGQLRNAIHDYLKRHKLVKSYHFADVFDGGSNATIVEFK